MDKDFYNESSSLKLGWEPHWFGCDEFDDDLAMQSQNIKRKTAWVLTVFADRPPSVSFIAKEWLTWKISVQRMQHRVKSLLSQMEITLRSTGLRSSCSLKETG